MKQASIEDLKGQTFSNVYNKSNEELIFENDKGIFIFAHDQECCEEVYIESIVGDLSDLIGEPILGAEESTREGTEEDYTNKNVYSATWTFYKFRTRKGYVDVRWLGESNGCYSEKVSLYYKEWGT